MARSLAGEAVARDATDESRSRRGCRSPACSPGTRNKVSQADSSSMGNIWSAVCGSRSAARLTSGDSMSGSQARGTSKCPVSPGNEPCSWLPVCRAAPIVFPTRSGVLHVPVGLTNRVPDTIWCFRDDPGVHHILVGLRPQTADYGLLESLRIPRQIPVSDLVRRFHDERVAHLIERFEDHDDTHTLVRELDFLAAAQACAGA